LTLRRRWAGPEGLAWLGPGERAVHDRFHDPRHREGWLFGRLLAKELILATGADRLLPGHLAPDEIEIHSRDGLGRSVRPRALVRGRLQPWCLSIAHSDAAVMVALAQGPGWFIGVDLVSFQLDASESLSRWFSYSERRFVDRGAAAERGRRAAAVWAAKEAAYKAVGGATGFRPERIEARMTSDASSQVSVRYRDGGGPEPSTWCRVEIGLADGDVVAVATVLPDTPGGRVGP
jgi:phosphopantetheinyl transferase